MQIAKRGTIRLHRDGNGRPYTRIVGWELDGPATVADVESAAFAREFVGIMCRQDMAGVCLLMRCTLVRAGGWPQ